MREKPSFQTNDERIFTLNDVKRLCIREKKKILRAAWIGGVLAIFFLFTKTPKYKVEASFQEASPKTFTGENLVKDFLGGSGLINDQPQAKALMISHQVLRPLVERLGLGAQVPSSGKFSRAYCLLRDNLLAERGKSLPDLDPFVFQNVHYDKETPLFFWMRFEDEQHFSLLDHKKETILSTEVGKEIQLPEVSFTLSQIPKAIRFHHYYPLHISSWIHPAQELRSLIQINSAKNNKAIYSLKFFHRDRRFGVRVLNELMAEYRNYLKNDYDFIAQEQLAYLEMRQMDLFKKLVVDFEKHAEYLSRNLESNGFVDIQDESKVLLAPIQQMILKVDAIDLELSRLDQLERENHIMAPTDDGPFAHRLAEISHAISDLKQQRDLLELSLQRQSIGENQLEARFHELQEIRSRRNAAKQLLCAVDHDEELQCNFPFDPERTLASWAKRLKKNQENGTEDFVEYLDNHIRLLSLQEKMLQERFFYDDEGFHQFEGIDLPTVQSLFVQYSNQLDSCEASMLHYSQLQREIDQKEFEISSLSSVLKDPLSQGLIASASQIGLQLKDEKHHSLKEGQRWEEELSLQKKILKDHLRQLFKVEELNASLIREKIIGLQKTSLDCIHQQISVLNEQALDAMKERREGLIQEKKVLERKIRDLSERASKILPEKWSYQQWLELKTQLGLKMMHIVTQLVESKTIGRHLHHVESKPLDMAILPNSPVKPRLLMMIFIGMFGAGFSYFFIRLINTILKGFPSSFEKLTAMQYPLMGKISSLCDGYGIDAVTGSDLELLREIGLFLETLPKTKIASLLIGRGPDYSYALAEILARKSIRSLIVRCDFQSKFRTDDQPGILQVCKGEISELPIHKKKGFDVLFSGGFTPYGAEMIQSTSFLQLMDQLKKKYDVLILLFRSPLDTVESKAALQLCDKSIVTVSGEPTEQLTPFVNWAYHEGNHRLTFIVSDYS